MKEHVRVWSLLLAISKDGNSCGPPRALQRGGQGVCVQREKRLVEAVIFSASMSRWVNWDSNLGLVLKPTTIETKQHILLFILNWLRFGFFISTSSLLPGGMWCLVFFYLSPRHGRSELFKLVCSVSSRLCRFYGSCFCSNQNSYMNEHCQPK